MGNYLNSKENKPIYDNYNYNGNDNFFINNNEEKNNLYTNINNDNNNIIGSLTKVDIIKDNNLEINTSTSLTQQVKNITSIVNNLSEEMKKTSLNIGSLNLALNNISKLVSKIKEKNNNSLSYTFPMYNDFMLGEMKHEFIEKKKKEFKKEIKREIKDKYISSILDKLKKKKKEISILKKENDNLKNELKNLNNQILTDKNELKNQLANVSDCLKKQIENENKNLKGQISDLIKKNDNDIGNIRKYINSEIDNIKKKYDPKMAEFENYKKKSQIDITNLQKQIPNEIKTLKSHIITEMDKKEKQYNSKFDNFEKLNKENNIEIGKVKIKSESVIELLKKEIEKINTEQERLKAQDEIKTKELKNLNEKINKNKEEIANANEQIEIINKNSRKNTLDIIRESIRTFNDTLTKKRILYKQKIQHDNKLELFSDNKYARVGLNNIGNNCYINSVLQILKNIPKFTYNLTQLNDKDKFLLSLKNLLINICISNKSSFSPEEFKTNLGMENKRFSDNNQYDSTIFYISLLNIINKKLNTKKNNYKKIDMAQYADKSLQERFKIWKENYLLKNQTFIFQFFYIFYVNEIECNSCHHINQSFQATNFLDFPIVSEKKLVKNLEECFENYQMIKNLKNECSKCNKSDQSQHFTLLELPPVLIINLKRVGENVAYFNEIDIPFQLDMEKIIKKVKNISIYELRGFIKHLGDENSGHNFAFCKNMFDDKWYKYNDSNCNLINGEPQLDKIFLLCYIQVGSDVDNIEYLKKIIDSFNVN